jgi:hypothetical protein
MAVIAEAPLSIMTPKVLTAPEQYGDPQVLTLGTAATTLQLITNMLQNRLINISSGTAAVLSGA